MAKDNGVIVKGKFDQASKFAVELRMPRNDAIRNCVWLVLDNGGKTLKQGMIMKFDRFTKRKREL